jgi:hypothetical protein
VGLEFEIRASHLQSRHSTPRATPPVCFALAVLEMEPRLALNLSLPYLSLPSNK